MNMKPTATPTTDNDSRFGITETSIGQQPPAKPPAKVKKRREPRPQIGRAHV